MDTSTAVRQRILDLCRQRGITVNRLATISGVTQSTVNNIVSGRNHSATVPGTGDQMRRLSRESLL